jgi:hypothetical protein
MLQGYKVRRPACGRGRRSRMIAVVASKLLVKKQDSSVFFEVAYIQEKSDGQIFYCASDPKTQEQVFIDAESVTAIQIGRL